MHRWKCECGVYGTPHVGTAHLENCRQCINLFEFHAATCSHKKMLIFSYQTNSPVINKASQKNPYQNSYSRFSEIGFHTHRYKKEKDDVPSHKRVKALPKV
jgi:negative regulator of sigma E activity